MKNLLIITFALCLALTFRPCFAQSDITGEWTGYITQTPAGLSSKYYFALTITKEGDQFVGYSYIGLEDEPEYFGKMLFEGIYRDGNYLFVEKEITEQNLFAFAYWCKKDLTLHSGNEDGKFVIRGSWLSDDCSFSDGEIYLEQVFL